MRLFASRSTTALTSSPRGIAGDDEGSPPAAGPDVAAVVLRNGKTREGPAAVAAAPSSPSEVMPVRIRVSLNEMKVAQELSEMSEKSSEKSEMSTIAFCQHALRREIAPPSVGSVQTRIATAARSLGWSYTRTRDAWYADPRISIRPEELFRVEAVSGLIYQARQEVRKNDDAIARATALLGGEDAHLVRSIVAAVRSALGIRNRA